MSINDDSDNPINIEEKPPTGSSIGPAATDAPLGSDSEVPFSFDDVGSGNPVAPEAPPKKRGFFYKSGDNDNKKRFIIPILVLIFVVGPMLFGESSDTSVQVEVICLPTAVEEHKKYLQKDGTTAPTTVTVSCELRESKESPNHAEALCTVNQFMGTTPVKVCWDTVIPCSNMPDSITNQCVELQDGGSVEHLVPASAFPNQDGCQYDNTKPHQINIIYYPNIAYDEAKCTVSQEDGTRSVKACWDLAFTCSNQSKIVSRQCATVSDGESIEHHVPASALPRLPLCEPENSEIAVENLKVDMK